MSEHPHCKSDKKRIAALKGEPDPFARTTETTLRELAGAVRDAGTRDARRQARYLLRSRLAPEGVADIILAALDAERAKQAEEIQRLKDDVVDLHRCRHGHFKYKGTDE